MALSNINEKSNNETLQHVNQIQYLTILNLNDKVSQLENQIKHLEQLLRFTPILIKQTETTNSDTE